MAASVSEEEPNLDVESDEENFADLSEIIVDNTAYRRRTFISRKSCLKHHCRGFRVRMTALLSIFDIILNALVSALFLVRGYTNAHFDFYIWSAVVAFFILLTSLVSYRMGPAGSMDKVYYCLQLGICFECQNSLEHSNFGHATYTFKLITLIESLFRAFPLSNIKLFVLIWYNDQYPFWPMGAGNWILTVSILISVISYSFWFTYHINATLRDKYNTARESMRSTQSVLSYPQKPGASIAKYMNNCNKMIFCVFIALDFMERGGVMFVLLRYFPTMYAPIINYIVLPLVLMMEEIISYLVLLHCILPGNEISSNSKYKRFGMILVSLLSVTLIYDITVKSKINGKKKYLVLYTNMVSRWILMCILVAIAIYVNGNLRITKIKRMQLMIIQLAAIQFILITFTTFIAYMCERMVHNTKIKSSRRIPALTELNEQ